MSTAGLAILMRMGSCFCFKEVVKLNGVKYYKMEHLANGGFSVVDLVEDGKGRLFALKKIKCHSMGDQNKALKEVEYHKMLSHHNIISCIDSDLVGVPDILGNQTSQVLLLLPFYQNGTLHEELMRLESCHRHFDEVVALSIFRGICRGVQCMHSAAPHPLAHRDLKTGNILLESDLTPIIMDLGSVTLARWEVNGSSDALRIQDEAAECSSLPYRAPELFNVDSFCKIDERTDIWSLGCLLYALCFYKSPFDIVYERGDSVALAAVSGTITYPKEHPYSEGLMELIGNLLKVSPEERPFVEWVLNAVDSLISKAENIV